MKTFKQFILESFQSKDFVAEDYGALISPSGKFYRVPDYQGHEKVIHEKIEGSMSYPKFLMLGGIRIKYPEIRDVASEYYSVGMDTEKLRKEACETLITFLKIVFPKWKKHDRNCNIWFRYVESDERLVSKNFKTITELEQIIQKELSEKSQK